MLTNQIIDRRTDVPMRMRRPREAGIRHDRGGRTWPACLAALFVLGGVAQPAQADLFENFDDNAAAYTTLLAGEATASAINIRLASDTINTGTTGGFDSFFGVDPNRFLVIGDNSGGLGNNPDGQTAGSLVYVRFDTGSLGAGQQSLSVSFDFVFDTNLAPGTAGTRSLDDFSVALVDGADNPVSNLLFFDDVLRNEASRRGNFNQTVSFNLASAGNVYLAFALNEFNDTSSSAVGIDNIQVMAVPEADTVLLMLAGLGLVGLRCQRHLKA